MYTYFLKENINYIQFLYQFSDASRCLKANADRREMSVIYLQMFGKFLERWPFLVPRGDQAETWMEVNALETGSKGLSTCHFPTQDWKIFGERDDVTSIAGSPAPGWMPGSQSPLIILCRIRDQTTSLTPSRFYPCPHGLPPHKAVASIAWDHAPKSPGEVKFPADRWRCFRFLLLRAPPSLFLPTQEPSTEIQLCRQTPQGLPKTSSFCEKMSWLTSLPWKNTRYSSWCKGCGPESGLQRPPTPSAGQRAAASTTGGSSSQLPPRPGHATQWGESGLTSPPRWVKSVLIGRAFKGLVLWPKSYFHLYPQTVIFHMPGMSPTFLTHSHGRLTRGEEGIFSYKDPTHPFSHWWALEPGEPRFEAQH